MDDSLKNHVEEFDLDYPTDLSNKLLNYINKKEIKSYEIEFEDEFSENKFKINYENIINDFRRLLRKWRSV